MTTVSGGRWIDLGEIEDKRRGTDQETAPRIGRAHETWTDGLRARIRKGRGGKDGGK